MRTTLRIDDDLLHELKDRACKEKTSLASIVNRALRSGLRAISDSSSPQTPYMEKPVDLGPPALDLNKALQISTAMEDREALRKIAMRK